KTPGTGRTMQAVPSLYPFCFLCSMQAKESWKIIRLLYRKEGYRGNAQSQADELIGASLFLVNKQADQHSASSREYREEHRAFAQLCTCTQADEPGGVGRDEAEDGEDGKNEVSVQSELLCQDVSN